MEGGRGLSREDWFRIEDGESGTTRYSCDIGDEGIDDGDVGTDIECPGNSGVGVRGAEARIVFMDG